MSNNNSSVFNDIGNKLMRLAEVNFAILLCVFGITGLVFIIKSANPYSFDGEFWVGVGTIALGFGIAWINSCFIYAIGQVVDDLHKLRLNKSTPSVKGQTPASENSFDIVKDIESHLPRI